METSVARTAPERAPKTQSRMKKRLMGFFLSKNGEQVQRARWHLQRVPLSNQEEVFSGPVLARQKSDLHAHEGCLRAALFKNPICGIQLHSESICKVDRHIANLLVVDVDCETNGRAPVPPIDCPDNIVQQLWKSVVNRGCPFG